MDAYASRMGAATKYAFVNRGPVLSRGRRSAARAGLTDQAFFSRPSASLPLQLVPGTNARNRGPSARWPRRGMRL